MSDDVEQINEAFLKFCGKTSADCLRVIDDTTHDESSLVLRKMLEPQNVELVVKLHAQIAHSHQSRRTDAIEGNGQTQKLE